jgi:subtilase family serine protease
VHSGLEETVRTLENSVSSLEESAGSMQMYIVIALIVGLVAGAVAIYLTKR